MSPVSSASPHAEAAVAEGLGGASLLLVHHLGPRQEKAARRALAAGDAVACLTVDASVAPSLRERVRVLGADAVPGFEEGALLAANFDLVESAVEEILHRRPSVARQLASITASERVDRYLCRAMLRDAGSFLGLLSFVASPELAVHERVVVEQRWPHGHEFAFLARIARERALPLPAALDAGLNRISFAAEAVPSVLRKLRGAVHAIRELGRLWRECFALVRLRPRAAARRPFLIRTYDWDWGFDRGGQRRLRNVDFVVDGETIERAEVAVWTDGDIPVEDEAGLRERGYPVLRAEGVQVGAAGFARRLLPALLGAVPLFARLATAERWSHEPVRRLLFHTSLWREVAYQVRPRVLLAVNDLHADAVARTFALRRAGCLTVEYEFSGHWRTDERGWVPDYVYAFAVVDAMATWGRLHSEHLRNHRGAIGEFWEVGCVWSEHARLVAENEELGAYYLGQLEREYGLSLAAFDHVVGVFDTSTASFFTADDMVSFYAGVAALARRLPGVLFLCKPKRDVAAVFAKGAGGREVEADLDAAPNVAVLNRFFETAAVVGLSDLSMNACFTSPALESIGLGRPAVYYDPTELFPASFFRRIPRLVATSVDELARLVEEQLALEGEELAADLRARFGALEAHFDGLAITRLRERLRAVLDA